MSNEEMFNLMEEFKKFIKEQTDLSPALYPAMDIILKTFYTWYANGKIRS
jgi:hypothetical protein